MHVEQSFRDDKSGGFDLHATHLTDPKRLDTLLLALAVAILWIYQLGEEVIRSDTRSVLDPAYKRQLSVFQLGWRDCAASSPASPRPRACSSVSPLCRNRSGMVSVRKRGRKPEEL
jgi:hypothetical protein